MTDAVLRSTEGRIGILTVNNPPVNALSPGVPDGIRDAVEQFVGAIEDVSLPVQPVLAVVRQGVRQPTAGDVGTQPHLR